MHKPRWAFIHPFQLRLRRGIESYLWNISAALLESGVDVDILTWNGPLSMPAWARDKRMHVYAAPEVRYHQALCALPYHLTRLVSGRRGHIFIHFAGYGEGLMLHLMRLLKPIPFSIVFHFPLSLVPHRYAEFERWKCQTRAAHLISVNQHVAKDVEEWAGRPCEVIENGVDAEQFAPDPELRRQTRARLGLPPDALVLITVAALEERKGIQSVTSALPGILERYPQVRYLVLGEGPYRPNIEELVRRMRLQDHVFLLGAVPDVKPYLCAADVFLLTSWGEASPIALFEAAAHALPLVTSHHPPFNELVASDRGVTVEPTNTDQVCRAVIGLLEDPSERARLGAAARRWVQSSHSWQRAAQKYRALIS